MTERPRVSVVVPACNEGEQVISVLDRLFESVRLPCEVLLVVDSADDTTVPVAEEYAQKELRVKCLVNTYGRGPADAIRFEIDAATASVTAVTMADGCDDARQIDELVRLVERGTAVAAASRYMPIWLDRQAGVSNFEVAKWVPSNVRWYRFAFGPRLTVEQVRKLGRNGEQLGTPDQGKGQGL